MGDNTSADIQKIKKRLFEVGQLDIDDSVINELITSCHAFRNIEEIIELIIGTPAYNNSVSYKNSSTSRTNVNESHKNLNESSKQNVGKTESKSVSARTTTILNEAGGKMENLNKDAEKITSNIQDHKAELSNDNIVESSEFDSDDDNYYENLYTDDNVDFLEDNNVSDENRDVKDFLPRNGLLSRLDSFSVEVHNETTHVLQSSAKTTKTYDASSSSDSEIAGKMQTFNFQAIHNSSSQPVGILKLMGYTSSADIVDQDSTVKGDKVDEVELLEENNNDPNNNLDSVQLQSESLPEFINRDAKNLDEGGWIECDSRESSPQPSCSKDFNPQPDIIYDLHTETNTILLLLPRFTYELVFTTLNKYRDASNRIECTLREILLSVKPIPEINKRKSMEDICTITSKKSHLGEHHSSRMNKRKGKNKKQTEFNHTDDCILITENVDIKNKERTKVMDVQACEMKVKSEGTLSEVSKVTMPNLQMPSENDNLIYHTADEGTPEGISDKVDSELVLKETANDTTIPPLVKKTDASVTSTITTTATSSTTDLVKSTPVSTSGNGTNVSSINKEEKSSRRRVKVNNEGMIPSGIITLMSTKPENKQTTIEHHANVPLQEIKNNKMQKTTILTKDTLTDPSSASGKKITDTIIPMDITMNCSSSEPVKTEKNVPLTVTSQDNKLIVSGGIDASIKSGILKAPKLVVNPSVQSAIPISRSKSPNKIIAPPKLVCAVNNTNISSARSRIIPIFTPTKMINSGTNKDKSSVVIKDKAVFTASNKSSTTQNLVKGVTASSTSTYTIAEQNRNYAKPEYKAIEVPGTSTARSKYDKNPYRNKINMSNLESTSNYKRPIILHEKQKEVHNKSTIKNSQEQGQTKFLSKNVTSHDVKMRETVKDHMNPINNPTKIIAGPSGHIPESHSTFPVHKEPLIVNPSVPYTIVNETRIEQVKEPEKRKEPATTVLRPDVVKYYYPMLSMFPEVDPTYIKEECNKIVNPSQGSVYEENKQFNMLVEHLLSTGSRYPRVHSNLEDNNKDELTYDVNECYLDLLDLFPNADPNYLWEQAEILYNNLEERKKFIQAKIDNPDYPTREEYMAKKQITEQQKQYTTKFSMTNFLEICPDPFSQFENKERQCKFQEDALEFLSYRFCQFRKDTLHRVYQNNRYNLSLTAKELQEAHPDRKTKRRIPYYLVTQNIPLLQEVAFITHREVLLEHMRNLAAEEAKEFKRLKKRNELLECQCCFDSEVMPSKSATCNDGHIFCYQCIRTGVETKLADGETHIQCFSDCGNEFSISVLQRVLSPTKFSILLQKRQEAEVMAAGLEGLVSCPFCHFASIPPAEDKVFKCLNPECMKETCRHCKELNHVPLKCEEANTDNVRHILEEKMTEALIRKCYKCRRPFFKEEGCNRMTCVCGAVMCYICDKPISNGYSHFSGQGSNRTDLCPLWSDNRRINAQTVAIAADEAVKELRKANPKVEIDARTLLPQVPQSSQGPHNDIPNSNIIPKRAYTLAKEHR